MEDVCGYYLSCNSRSCIEFRVKNEVIEEKGRGSEEGCRHSLTKGREKTEEGAALRVTFYKRMRVIMSTPLYHYYY